MEHKSVPNEESVKKSFMKSGLIDPRYYGIIVAVIVVIITLAILILYRRRQSAKRNVLIMGLCNSGKTLLFARLLLHQFRPTLTSIKENAEDCVFGNGVVKLVDIPGSERVRGKYFDLYKPLARAVIFVIDSSTILEEIRDIAELLFTILTDHTLASNQVKILIACNKQDELNSKSANDVQVILEKELNLLKSTKSHQLDSISDSGSKQVPLCPADKDFEFSKSRFVVDFAESSLSEKSVEGHQEVEEWIESRVV
nr:PREDICTED: signal recognition particle receptor subunit beta [Bemisia tabaci]